MKHEHSAPGVVFIFIQTDDGRKRLQSSFDQVDFIRRIRLWELIYGDQVNAKLYRVACRAIRARRFYVCHPELFHAYDQLCEYLYVHHRSIYTHAQRAFYAAREAQCQQPF